MTEEPILNNSSAEEPSLDEIIQRENEQLKNRSSNSSNKGSKKKAVVVGAVIAGLVAIGGGGYMMTRGDTPSSPVPTPSSSASMSQSSSSSPSASSSSFPVPGEDETPLWEMPGKKYPMSVPSWAEKSYKDSGFFKKPVVKNGKLDDSSPDTAVIRTYSDTEMASSSNRLPSERAGFTADREKMMLPDGTVNPAYVVWTSEVFQSNVGTILTRLLNPEFGGWSSYQYSRNHAAHTFRPDVFEDMMTPQLYAQAFTKKPRDWAMIPADWDENDYGMADKFIPDYGPRWAGRIDKTSMKWVKSADKKSYTVTMVLDVTYVAWDKDQNKLEKPAILKLEFVPNLGENTNPKSPYKVLLSKGTLEVK